MTTSTFHRTVAGCIVVTVAIALAGCGGLSKPYPAKSYYAIQVERPAATSSAQRGTLRVARARVAEPFNGRELHYMTADGLFEADYYVNFITRPSNMLTAEIIGWLSAAGPYETVVDISSLAGGSRTLETAISELYADRTTSPPTAVIAARFFLLDTTTADAIVLLQRDDRRAVPLRGEGSDALVAGWSEGLAEILEALTAELAATEGR